MDVSAQSVQGSTKNNRFDNFLAMFSTVNCLDSMVNVCDLILMRDIKESSDVNDNIREWASPIVPFFQQTPIAKFADEYGWCVLILNSYRVANIEPKSVIRPDSNNYLSEIHCLLCHSGIPFGILLPNPSRRSPLRLHCI